MKTTSSYDRLNKVTSLSKVLAATVFIVLPFIMLFVGYVLKSRGQDIPVLEAIMSNF